MHFRRICLILALSSCLVAVAYTMAPAVVLAADPQGPGPATGSTTAGRSPTRVAGPPMAGRDMSAGSEHVCVLLTDGSARCWGDNSSGQLGTGLSADASSPVPVQDLDSAATSAAGGDHSCAVTADGRVQCWGSNVYGELGDGTRITRRTPVAVMGLPDRINAVAAGKYHTCALTATGQVWCWGYNGYGQLGDNTTYYRLVPVQVQGLSEAVHVLGAGDNHTCAAANSAAGMAVFCWGANYQGQLGDGARGSRKVPVQVFARSSTQATALAAGITHTCLATLTAVFCWGFNGAGQLGDSTTTDRLTPVQVGNLEAGALDLALGKDHTCALTTTGGVKCWGYNADGQLGDGSTTTRREPVDVYATNAGVKAVSAGADFTCALLASGGVKCWGQVPPGTARVVSPADVPGLAAGIAGLSAGTGYSCMVSLGGEPRCWGWNSAGQLGDGTKKNSLGPVGVSGLGAGVASVVAGQSHTCALSTGGTVYCWGKNDAGQLGDGTNTDRLSPVEVSGLEPAVAVVVGYEHTCALTAAGGVKCWGANWSGQLGNGGGDNRSKPVAVTGLTSGVTALAAGASHTCAVLSGGTARCWGGNRHGELGDGTAVESRATPVTVSGLSWAKAIASHPANGYYGGWHTCALLTTGGIKCWGWNYHGQLGDGTQNQRNKPVSVLNLGGTAVAIAVGAFHSCALLSNSRVMCWGDTAYGQLGIPPTSIVVSTPIYVPGLLSAGVIGLAAGHTHNCAVTAGRIAVCWGSNSIGELGDGTIAPVRTTPVGVAMWTVRGRVVDAAGRALPGVAVTAAGGRAGLTASDGFYELGNLPPTSIAITPTLPSYTFEPPARTVDLPPDAGRQDFVAAPMVYAITGETAVGATSLPGAQLTLSTGQTAVAGADGRFSLSGLISGTYTLTPTLPGYNFWPIMRQVRVPPAVAGQDFLATSVTYSGTLALAAGDDFTCALNERGGARCWGSNEHGQLGIGETGRAPLPVLLPALRGGAATLAAGGAHACALANGGSVLCWGRNDNGQLGDGTAVKHWSPVVVQELATGVRALAAGNAHTCALAAGAAYCWGWNGLGQLGDGSTNDRRTPVRVAGLAKDVAGLTAGGDHTCAVTTAGGLRCWGDNQYGQLGDGTTIGSLAPVPVLGLDAGVTAVTAGKYHTCALLQNGEVRCWGANWYGQLGDGSLTDRLEPMRVPDLAGVTGLAAGWLHTCALTAEGARCWGYNGSGQVGDGSRTDRLAPVIVAGLRASPLQITAGAYHTCALTADARVMCWGDNDFGQLGDGTTAVRAAPVNVRFYLAAGRITWQGQGLPGVALRLSNGEQATSAADGSFSFPALLPGSYTIIPALPGYLFTPATLSFAMPPTADGLNFAVRPENQSFVPLVLRQR